MRNKKTKRMRMRKIKRRTQSSFPKEMLRSWGLLRMLMKGKQLVWGIRKLKVGQKMTWSLMSCRQKFHITSCTGGPMWSAVMIITTMLSSQLYNYDSCSAIFLRLSHFLHVQRGHHDREAGTSFQKGCKTVNIQKLSMVQNAKGGLEGPEWVTAVTAQGH